MITMCKEEMEKMRNNGRMESREKDRLIQAKRMESIRDVIEDAEVIIDTHYFNEFSEANSSLFLKKVIAHQNSIDARLLKTTWRTMNGSPKTMKGDKGKYSRTSFALEKDDDCHQEDRFEMLVQQGWVAPERKNVISCYKKVSGEISARHDIVVNILNIILVQRGLVSNEQKWDEMKTVRMANEEITIVTEHQRSDEWKEKGRVAGARLKPDPGVASSRLRKRLGKGRC